MTRFLVALMAGLVFPALGWLPWPVLNGLARTIGLGAYYLVPRRRKAAIENLRRFYDGEKSPPQIRVIARRSGITLALPVFETLRRRRLLVNSGIAPPWTELFVDSAASLGEIVKMHRATGGCIFVTAHVGSYAILPDCLAALKIPLTVPINPLRNSALQSRWCPLERQCEPDLAMFVAKKNALPALLQSLDRGCSVGLLADQRSTTTIAFDAREMRVLTTPLPALLALQRQRPIIVGACLRGPGAKPYQLVLSAPIWPEAAADENRELRRLANEVDQQLALLVRANPDQYLWMHNRWKPHRRRNLAGLNTQARSAQ